MQIRIFPVLVTGGMACLLSTALTFNTLHAQEPVPAPVPEPDNGSQTGTQETTTGAVVTGGYVYGCPTNDCYDGGHHGHKGHKIRYRPDYRRGYCRPEPFARNDCRDQYIFSEQGYGVPVTVPLAPVVCKQYNYGWGLPSSRLTHVPFGWQTYRPPAPPAQSGATSRPIVYWPTDTMQEGVYYMRTPW